MHSYRNSDPRPPIMQGSPPAVVVLRQQWDRPPWNRWAFQHMREIVATAEVWRGAGPVRVLPAAPADLDGLAVGGSDGTETTLAGLLDETFTDGFLVMHDGVVVYERYFNGMEQRTPHLSQSVAKSLTSALAGILVAKGLLDPKAPVTEYLPELEETAWRGASLRQVLDMTTGVHFSEDYTDPYSDVGQCDVACGWKTPPVDADPGFKWPRHMWELVQSLAQSKRPHGRIFDYRSIETDVLAFCLERVSGKRLPQLVSEEIWQKAGMEESASFTVDSAGYGLAQGGFNATLRDYARFGQLFLDQGGCIIPQEWVEATRNGNHAIFKEPYTLAHPEGAYRNQFWIEDPRSRAIMAKGVFGQLIYINWEYRLVAVKLSSWPDFLNTAYDTATRAAIHRIANALPGSGARSAMTAAKRVQQPGKKRPWWKR